LTEPAETASPAESAVPAESTAPVESAMPSATGGTIGFLTDDVDHQARRTYKIGYFYTAASNLTKYMFECMTNISDRLNVDVADYTSENDNDRYLNNLEIAALAGVDGFICTIDPNINDRAYELLEELGVPYLSLFNAVTDANGAEIVPVVMMNQYLNGYMQVQYMYEHYMEYWGEIDTSKIALLVMAFSLNPDLETRSQGAQDYFKEVLPDNPIFIGDTASGSLNMQTSYDESAAIISANPDIEYWFCACVVEDLAMGVARVAEDHGKTDCLLATGSGSSVLPGEWDAGYEGCWIGNFAVSNYQYAVPALCGLIAMIDGRATAETLWPEYKREGDKCAQFTVGEYVITKPTYKSFFKEIEESFGIYTNAD
jgi:ABC-type sugar transport system substrate-binding protein